MVDCERFLDDGPPGAYLPLRWSAMAPHSAGDLPGRPEVRRTRGMETGARGCFVLGAAATSWTAAREKASKGNVAERIMVMWNAGVVGVSVGVGVVVVVVVGAA
jgi:hypothetical protein